MEYWEGDEFVNVDSLNTIYLGTIEEDLPTSDINVYPNPFDETIAIEYSLLEASHVSIFIYDMSGKVVNKLFRGEQQAGAQKLVWDGKSEDGANVSNGLYNYSMLIDGRHNSGRIIKN